VLSGDTRPVNTVIENSQGCDVLLHEVYSQTGFDNLPVPQDDFLKKFMLEYHTSTRELVDIANAAKPGLLILYHQMFLHDSRQDAGLLDEIQHTYGYTGQVVSARDLDVY
jgi:ribonuclease Z